MAKTKEQIINDTYDYCANVFERQGGYIEFDRLYAAYTTMFKKENQMTEAGLKIVYNAILDILGIKPCINANCHNGIVVNGRFDEVICQICKGKRYITNG